MLIFLLVAFHVSKSSLKSFSIIFCSFPALTVLTITPKFSGTISGRFRHIHNAITSIDNIADTSNIDNPFLFDDNKLKFFLYDFNNSWDENFDLFNSIDTIMSTPLDYDVISNNSISINIPDSTYILNWCDDNSDFGAIIEYTPSPDDALQLIEWYSSNNSAFRPSLNIDYVSKIESDNGVKSYPKSSAARE